MDVALSQWTSSAYATPFSTRLLAASSSNRPRIRRSSRSGLKNVPAHGDLPVSEHPDGQGFFGSEYRFDQ